MKRKSKKKLTLDDRINIQAYLHKGYSLSEIARRLGKSKSSISREIKRNSKTTVGHTCTFKFVCNTCPKRAYCNEAKRYYDCSYANDLANKRLVKSRAKTMLDEESIEIINSILSEGIKQTKSFHHVYIANPILSTICSERTCRRLIYRGELLDVRPYELRRFVRFNHAKKRDSNPIPQRMRNIEAYAARTYSNYIEYTNEHPKLNVAQFDTVIGTKYDKYAILTITFPKYEFQFGIKVLKDNPGDVNRKLYALFKKLGKELTEKLFAICLCDNGFEFDKFYKIEEYGYDIKTFYTRTYKSSDKPHCETYHRFLRYIYPKGHSLDDVTQEDINDSFSNINGLIRESLKDKSPYDILIKKFGSTLLTNLKIRRINPNSIKLLAKI